MRSASLALVFFLACSNNNPNNDGGTDSGGGDTSNNVIQTGTIVDFSGGNGLQSILVTGGGSSATTDSKGAYSLSVAPNTAYTMQASAPDGGYVSLDEQEWKLLGSANRGKTSFVSNVTENLLKSILSPQPDPTLAVLSVIVLASGTCSPDAGGADVTGATVSVPGLPAADAGADAATGGPVVVYFANGLPSSTATSVTAGQLPSALVYNLPPTASFNQVTVTHPTCKQAQFPIAEPSAPNIQYTGNVKLEASGSSSGTQIVSNLRLVLQ